MMHAYLSAMEDLFEWSKQFPAQDALDRLAASLFVRSNNPGGRIMAMFTAYFDAAGNAADQPFVIVTGYLANTFQWRVFESMWTKLHEDYEVNLPFHTSEFMAAMTNPERYAQQANARRDYLQLAERPKAALEFFKNMCIAEITVVNCAISCVVPGMGTAVLKLKKG